MIAPIRFSRLKWMAQSPLHFLGASVEKTASIEKGTAVHSLVLGGPPVIFYPGKVRNGKDWEAFKELNKDAEILTRSDYDTAHRMAEAVNNNALAMSVLKGMHEQQLSWSINKRACTGRIDCIGETFVSELKTGVTANPTRFQWQAIRMGYNSQCAWYQDGVEAAGLGTKPDAYVVMVENKAPFATCVYQMTPRALDMGRRQYRLWFERVLQCEAVGAWPSYCESIVPLDVPEDDFELTFSEEDAA